MQTILLSACVKLHSTDVTFFFFFFPFSRLPCLKNKFVSALGWLHAQSLLIWGVAVVIGIFFPIIKYIARMCRDFSRWENM